MSMTCREADANILRRSFTPRGKPSGMLLEEEGATARIFLGDRTIDRKLSLEE